MERWRKKAVQLLPKLQRDILEAESIGMLWTVLSSAFVRAHKEPQDDERIQAIYASARWAVEAGDQGPGGRCTDEDWASLTVVHFYENLPMEPRVVTRMHEFMGRDEILGFSEVFKYHLKPDQHQAFIETVLAARDRWTRSMAKKA
ncbi:MAG: hypothetical protein JST24_00610 [Acidobacteria bacterium]|nr:hypothetical protein [Acidobacteriota bacterium]